MTTSMDSMNPIIIKFDESSIECADIVLSKDRHAITVSMSISNKGQTNLLINVNYFCLVHDNTEIYVQHCYINDGQSFELNSGWKSISCDKSYSLIMKYCINPNLSTYDLCYKSTHEQYYITSFGC